MTLPIEALETRCLLSFSPIQLGTKGLDAGFQTVVDSGGNTIVTGIFSHTMNVGNDSSGSPVLVTAVGETDIFVAKYDPAGKVLWAGHIGGEQSSVEDKPDFPIDPSRIGDYVTNLGPIQRTLGEDINALAVDANGNIFLGGSFLRTADFDPGPGVYLLNAAHTYKSYTDAFVEKLDPNGTLVWADDIGGQFDDSVMGIAVDPQGNPVVTGYFTRAADFDPTSKGVFNVDALGRDDIFVAKYTAAGGKLVWVDTFGSDDTSTSERDSGNAITVDSLGNIFVTGTFTGKTDFDPGPSKVYIEAVKRTDQFMLELSPRGKRVLVSTLGGKSYDGGMKIAVQDGNIYTANYFTGEVDVTIGKVTQQFISVADDRHTDILITKYNSKGAIVWAKQIGGDGFETIGGLAVGADGSVFTSGGFYDTVDFDPGPGTDNISSIPGDDNFDDPNDGGRDNSYDIFVSRLSTNGKFLSATRIGSSGDDFGGELALTPDGTSFVLTGQFRNTVPFDSDDNTNKLKSKGSTDGFLIELSENLKLLT